MIKDNARCVGKFVIEKKHITMKKPKINTEDYQRLSNSIEQQLAQIEEQKKQENADEHLEKPKKWHHKLLKVFRAKK